MCCIIVRVSSPLMIAKRGTAGSEAPAIPEYIYILRYRRRFGGDRRGPDGFTFTEAAAGRFTFQTAVSFSNSRFVGFIFNQPFRYLVISICVCDDLYVSGDDRYGSSYIKTDKLNYFSPSIKNSKSQ